MEKVTKVLGDGSQVPARTYYYLLDWNDLDNFKYMISVFGGKKLCELTINEYFQLFDHAQYIDAQTLINKIKP